MKKLILSLALCCAATNFFAQEADLGKLRNDGIAALEAKDYQTAYNNFSSYLNQTNNQDSVIAFNCGICADKIKKAEDAVKYFDIAIQKKYNLTNAYIGKAGALKDLKKNDEYVATLKEAVEAIPGDKKLVSMYATYYVILCQPRCLGSTCQEERCRRSCSQAGFDHSARKSECLEQPFFFVLHAGCRLSAN